MVEPNQIEQNIGNFIKYHRPFEIPEGKFDESRQITDEEYQKKL